MNLFGWLLRTDQQILDSLQSLNRRLDAMTTALENLQTAVAAEATVEASVVTLLTTLSADLQSAIASNNPAAIQAVADQITANTATLAAAVTANTPAAPAAPAPAAPAA
jgi:hypothetical protein